MEILIEKYFVTHCTVTVLCAILLKLPSGVLNGNAIKLPPSPMSDYVLELSGVSYIRSFTTGRWYSKVFNPPITAQFLKDINLEVHGGEIMGIVGAGGTLQSNDDIR